MPGAIIPPCFLLAVPGIPLAVLAASYALLAREFGTWRLWHVTIHESGRRTLRDTVFYPNHFLRELPIDTLFAAAIVSAYSAVGVTAWRDARVSLISHILLAVLVVWVCVGAVRSVGLRGALGDLFQLHETDVREGWGSHWQMHFLSTAALLLLFLLPVAMLESGSFAGRAGPLLVAFVALSIVFGTGLKAITDRRWILHGAREVLTYAVMIALPMYLPLLGLQTSSRLRVGPIGVAILCCLFLVAAYMVIVRLRSDLNTEASSPRGVAFLLSSHFFEHTLDYAYIALVILSAMA